MPMDAERLTWHLEQALRLAREVAGEARAAGAWPKAGTAGHIAEVLSGEGDAEAGLVNAARALGSDDRAQGDPKRTGTLVALVKERLEVNGLAETVRGLATLLGRDSTARQAFEELVRRGVDRGVAAPSRSMPSALHPASPSSGLPGDHTAPQGGPSCTAAQGHACSSGRG
jgi:hypothetical protein